MTLPTSREINPHRDPGDGAEACAHFLGRSLEEAEALFRESSIYYQSDLMWMGPVAFRYYLPAVAQYIYSDSAAGEYDFIAHFAGTLEFRLEHESQELIPVADQLVALSGYIVEHWAKFEAADDAYGDVCGRFQAIQRAFVRLTGK